MGKTIIQTIGPLYGEVVNGTVFGRPNGSVFIPSVNTISVGISENADSVRQQGNDWNLCKSDLIREYYSLVAESQDSASYLAVQLSDDPDFATDWGIKYPAGMFNIQKVFHVGLSSTALVPGTTYYVRFVLMASSGVAVATTETYELTGVSA